MSIMADKFAVTEELIEGKMVCIDGQLEIFCQHLKTR